MEVGITPESVGMERNVAFFIWHRFWESLTILHLCQAFSWDLQVLDSLRYMFT